MTATFVDVWQVTVSDDDRSSRTLGFFWTEGEAKNASKGTSYFGSDGEVKKVHGIMIGQRFFLATEVDVFHNQAEMKKHNTRRSALSKLTAEEKKELGL